MPLESATSIMDLVESNPPQSDQVAQGAGHLRLIKSVLKASFPAMGGAPFRSLTKTASFMPATRDSGTVFILTANNITTVTCPPAADWPVGTWFALYGGRVPWDKNFTVIPGPGQTFVGGGTAFTYYTGDFIMLIRAGTAEWMICPHFTTNLLLERLQLQETPGVPGNYSVAHARVADSVTSGAAGGLNVNHATTADTATNATNATNAVNAQNATRAQSAAIADGLTIPTNITQPLIGTGAYLLCPNFIMNPSAYQEGETISAPNAFLAAPSVWTDSQSGQSPVIRWAQGPSVSGLWRILTGCSPSWNSLTIDQALVFAVRVG
jgi:hypothetical protein